MKFARQSRQQIDVNMTPLIDVVFLLLIFFMVSTTFTKESRLGLNLPQAIVGEIKPLGDNKVDVVIDATGQISIAGQKLLTNDRASIKYALQGQIATRAQVNSGAVKPSLTISADAATAHQYVITVMDIAGQLGFSQLSMTTLKKER